MLRRTPHRRSLLRPTLWFALGWISLVVALDSPLHELGEQLFWVHIAARGSRADLRSAARTRASRSSPAFGHSPLMARRSSGLGPFKHFQDDVGLGLRTTIGMVVIGDSVVDMAHSLAIRPNTSQRLDSRRATHDFPGERADLLVAFSESHGDDRLRRRIGIRLHHNSPHKRPGGAPDLCPQPWYSSYITTAPARGLTALEDQQLGGLIMWIPAGTLLLIVALVLLVKWMNEAQTDGNTHALRN